MLARRGHSLRWLRLRKSLNYKRWREKRVAAYSKSECLLNRPGLTSHSSKITHYNSFSAVLCAQCLDTSRTKFTGFPYCLTLITERKKDRNSRQLGDCAVRAGETARQLKEHLALSEDFSPIPSTHMGQLTTACNSKSRGLNVFFWHPWHSA